MLVPGLLAFVFGFFAFRSRIKGVYFSIITQALTYAAMLLFFRNDTGFGGNNGFTDFKRILGYPIADAADAHGAVRDDRRARCSAFFAAGRCARRSRSSAACCTAIRDAEIARDVLRLRPARTTSCSSGRCRRCMCGIAGALYVPQVGIINPSEMSPANSIEIAIWVAVGGRGTLVGPIVGAVLVNGAQELVHAGAARVLAVRPRRCCSSLVTLFLPRRHRRRCVPRSRARSA